MEFYGYATSDSLTFYVQRVMQVWFMCERGWFFFPHFAYNSNSVHVEPFWQVNDVVVTSNDTLVSCSSDTTLKVYSLAFRISAALLSFG